MSEGLVRPSTSKRRAYECADDAAFDAAINAWKSAADGDGGENGPRKRRGKSAGGSKKGQQEQAIKAVPPEATQSSALDAPKSRPSDVSQDTPPAAMDSIPSFTAMESPKKTEKPAPRKAEWEAVRLNRARSSVGVPVRWSAPTRSPVSPRNAKKDSVPSRAYLQFRPNTDSPENRCRSTRSGEQRHP